MKGKHIVVGITGGIAAYKSCHLVRLFVKAGAEVQVILTPAAKEFITPVTLSTLSGKPVITEFFSANTGEWHSHVDLGLWADAMVIAPCTASTMGKMAHGIADNMLVTSYLSSRSPVFIAPAMDLDMWQHPTTQRNLSILEGDGVNIVMPEEGELASHLVGKGRMAEPETIYSVVERHLKSIGSPLKGKRVMVTAGPTYENIDPVRFIGNYSSGKMGFALAAEYAVRGADVLLVAGPVSLPTPPGVKRINVTSAREMCEVCVAEMPVADIAVMCAAVADYAPASCATHKIKREKAESMELLLVKNPDIAATLGKMKRPEQILVGFALETDHETENAVGKMARKNLDWIVLNSLRNPLAGFQKDTNQVTVIRADGEEFLFPPKLKREVASDIVNLISRCKD